MKMANGGWTPIYTKRERFIRWLLRKPKREYIITLKDVGLDGITFTGGERIKIINVETNSTKNKELNND